MALALVVGGCSLSRNEAVRVLAASDAAADLLGLGWSEAVHRRVNECRSTLPPAATPEDREECLGPFGVDETVLAQESVRLLISAQARVVEAAQCEEMGDCNGKVDWRALAADIVAAWGRVKPYLKEIRK